MYIIFLTHVFLTLFMLGVIWFVQFLHYPLLSLIEGESFCLYQRYHFRRMLCVISLPMLVEFVTGWWLLYEKIPVGSVGLLRINAGFLTLIWISSLCLQVPMHLKLIKSFDVHAHHHLVSTNWIRTVAWTVRSLLLGYIVYGLLMDNHCYGNVSNTTNRAMNRSGSTMKK